MKYILKHFRVKDWFHYLGYTLLASILSSNLSIINFVLTSFLLAYAYSINNYYDKKLKEKYFLIPLILSFFFLPFASLFTITIFLSLLVLFTLYSWPKVWLEGKPILSTLTNSIGFTLIFVLPMNSIKILLGYCPLVLLIFTLNTAAQLLHEIVDFKEDKKINKITTTVRFGVKISLVLFKLCLLSATVISALIFSHFPLISLSSIIFSLIFVLIKTVKRKTRKTFKIFGIIFGIVYMIELLK
jgi:4-hydroxybenzoate polyprenyltransferase